jgi:hypothetical protein
MGADSLSVERGRRQSVVGGGTLSDMGLSHFALAGTIRPNTQHRFLVLLRFCPIYIADEALWLDSDH